MKIANASNSNTIFSNQIRIQDYYDNSWDIILRPPTRLISGIVKVANDICENGNVGYSQAKRLTLYQEARYNDFNFATIEEVCYCDCSSFVGTIIKSLGANIELTTFTTSTMRNILKSVDFNCIDFKNEMQLKAGDILVKEGSHCIIILEDYKILNDTVFTDNEKNIVRYGIVKLKNTSSYLNVRKEPTTDSQAIDALDHNDRVKIIGENKGWYKIQYEDIIGYCSKAYIVIKKQ